MIKKGKSIAHVLSEPMGKMPKRAPKDKSERREERTSITQRRWQKTILFISLRGIGKEREGHCCHSVAVAIRQSSRMTALEP